MATLKLNGATVSALSGRHKEVVTGLQRPDRDGTLMRAHRSIRREWEFTSAVNTRFGSQALVGQVLGLGQQWWYESDLNSTKKLGPSASVATVIWGQDQQDDAADIYLESTGEKEAYFGPGALEMGPATTNVLPADSRDCENGDPPAGFTAYLGSTISAESSIYVQGTQSLKVVTSTTLYSGTYTDNATVTNGNTYTASAYIYTTEALSIRFRIYDSSGGSSSNTYTTTPNVWERVQVTRTMAHTVANVQVLHNGTAVKTIYCDAFQLEEQPTATPWVDGTRASPANGLAYNGIAGLSDSLSFCAWVRPPTANPSANKNLLQLFEPTGQEKLFIRRGSGNNDIEVGLVHSGSSNSYTYSSSPWDDGWHHIAVVLSGKDSGNDADKRLAILLDGSLVDVNVVTDSHYPYMKGMTTNCYIGCGANATTYWEGPIHEVFLVPYAMTNAQVAALAGRTFKTPGLPKLDMGGDCNCYASPAENYPVIGRVNRSRYSNDGDVDAYFQTSVDFSLLSERGY